MKRTLIFLILMVMVIPTIAQLSIKRGSVKQPHCFDCDEGGINIEANGGVEPYQYRLFDMYGDSTPWQYETSFRDLPVGQYYFQMRDANFIDAIYPMSLDVKNPDGSFTVNPFEMTVINLNYNEKLTMPDELIGMKWSDAMDITYPGVAEVKGYSEKGYTAALFIRWKFFGMNILIRDGIVEDEEYWIRRIQ